MELFNNFKSLFLSVWERGILGVDILEILIGVGIFFLFLIFRGIISKVIIKRLEFKELCVGKWIPLSFKMLLTFNDFVFSVTPKLLVEIILLLKLLKSKTTSSIPNSWISASFVGSEFSFTEKISSVVEKWIWLLTLLILVTTPFIPLDLSNDVNGDGIIIGYTVLKKNISKDVWC